MNGQVIIKPLEGIEWGDKVVSLGSSLSSVTAVLGGGGNYIWKPLLLF